MPPMHDRYRAAKVGILWLAGVKQRRTAAARNGLIRTPFGLALLDSGMHVAVANRKTEGQP